MPFRAEKNWVSYSRVFFSLYLVFYPPLLLPVNTKHHGGKKKEQNQTPPTICWSFLFHFGLGFFVCVFPTMFWILKKKKKGKKINAAPNWMNCFQFSADECDGENWMATYNSHSEHGKHELYLFSSFFSELNLAGFPRDQLCFFSLSAPASPSHWFR